MSKCSVCDKNLGFFSTKTICDNCNDFMIKKVKTIIANHNILNKDYGKKGKKLSYYLEISLELIKIQEELEALSKIIPNIITECEDNESYTNKLKNNVVEYVDTQISIIKEKNSISDNQKELTKDLKKLFEEVSECKINYEFYSDVLNECQNKIKSEIK